MYHHGLVVGKFAPFHMGHKYLINSALRNCDHVTVCVVDSPVAGFDVPAAVRATWIDQSFHHTPRVRPRVLIMPDIHNDDNSAYWAEYTKEFLGFTPDAVFTSEDYGETWAAELGCAHVQVDKARTWFPTSGTEIRMEPWRHLDMLPPVVKAHYAPRVVICGAESTGTTTLTKALGEHYGIKPVPEFGRIRDEEYFAKTGKVLEWGHDDFVYTAVMQQFLIDKAARKGMVIADTDALATALWEERYLGSYGNNEVLRYAKKHQADLYIITDYHGVEEEEDGFRFEMHKRPQMQRDFLFWLDLWQHDNVLLVSGSHEDRLEQAISRIDLLTGTRASATL